jgi:hypothetical protein
MIEVRRPSPLHFDVRLTTHPTGVPRVQFTHSPAQLAHRERASRLTDAIIREAVHA